MRKFILAALVPLAGCGGHYVNQLSSEVRSGLTFKTVDVSWDDKITAKDAASPEKQELHAAIAKSVKENVEASSRTWYNGTEPATLKIVLDDGERNYISGNTSIIRDRDQTKLGTYYASGHVQRSGFAIMTQKRADKIDETAKAFAYGLQTVITGN